MRPANISSGGASNYYYERDPLFNPEKDQANAEWIGHGAAAMGLSGPIKKEDFEKVIVGKDPNGEQLVRPSLFNGEKRAGVDIPLGTPAAVSYAGLVLKDERVIDAQKEAVKDTIKMLENKYSYTRDQTGGKCTQELQGNITAATFMHSMNRNNEPYLHTHCVIMNMVQQPDGSYKALSNDAIMRDQAYISKYYQSALAEKIQQLGYAIETRANGTWDIAGYDPKLKAVMSTRHDEVQAAKDELRAEGKTPNASDGALDKIAQRGSRNEKDTKMTADKFDALNAQRHEQAGVTPEQQRQAFNEAAVQAKEKSEAVIPQNEREAVKQAVNQLQATESQYTKQDVLKQAMVNSFGAHGPAALEEAFKHAERSGEIVLRGPEIDSRGNVKAYYSTPEQVRCEKNNIRLVEGSKGKAEIVFDRQEVRAFIAQKETSLSTPDKAFQYTKGQKDTIETIASSKDNVVLVQGDAGTGKTKSMEAIKDFADKHNIPIIAVSFTGKAAAQIQADSGIKSYTIHSYLGQRETQKAGNEIVDRAKYSELAGKISAADRAQLAQPVTQKDVQGGFGLKNLIYEGQIQNHGARIRDERIGEGFKNRAMDDLKNLKNSITGNVSHFITGRGGKTHEQNRTYDVLIKTQNGEYERARQVKHFEVKAGGNETSYTSLTYRANGDIYKYTADTRGRVTRTQNETIRNPDNLLPTGRGILIVDENSMTDARQGEQLLRAAAADGQKVVLVGDVSQKNSIGAGRLFSDLQNYTTVDRANLTESVRFKTQEQIETVAHLKAANETIKAGDIPAVKQHTDAAIDRIAAAGNLVVASGQKAQEASAILRYFNFADKGETAMIMTSTNVQRHSLNDQIRAERQSRGEIGKGEAVTVRDPVSVGTGKAALADAYKEGWQVRANANVAGLKKGEIAHIIGLDRVNNSVTLTDSNGKAHTIKAAALGENKLSFYEKGNRQFAQGDRLIFGENDKKLGVMNGQTGTVTAIDKRGNITAKMDDGKEKRFNTAERQERQNGDAKYKYDKIDHAYASTAEKAQGATVQNAIAIEAKDTNDLTVKATRAEFTTTLITANLEQLRDRCAQPQASTSNIDRMPKQTLHPIDLRAAQNAIAENGKLMAAAENISKYRDEIKKEVNAALNKPGNTLNAEQLQERLAAQGVTLSKSESALALNAMATTQQIAIRDVDKSTKEATYEKQIDGKYAEKIANAVEALRQEGNNDITYKDVLAQVKEHTGETLSKAQVEKELTGLAQKQEVVISGNGKDKDTTYHIQTERQMTNTEKAANAEMAKLCCECAAENGGTLSAGEFKQAACELGHDLTDKQATQTLNSLAEKQEIVIAGKSETENGKTETFYTTQEHMQEMRQNAEQENKTAEPEQGKGAETETAKSTEQETEKSTEHGQEQSANSNQEVSKSTVTETDKTTEREHDKSTDADSHNSKSQESDHDQSANSQEHEQQNTQDREVEIGD